MKASQNTPQELEGESLTLLAKDYKEQFNISGKELTDEKGLQLYKPHQVKILSYLRLNKNPNPANNAIIYLMETFDGKKGTLIYKYDAFKDSRVFNFLKKVVDFQLGNNSSQAFARS